MGPDAGNCGFSSFPKGMTCGDHEERILMQEGSGLVGREKLSIVVTSDPSF